MARRRKQPRTLPYKVPGEYSTRDILVFVYQEYKYRLSVYNKIIGNTKKKKDWSIKVDKFVEVFNRLEHYVEKAKPLPIVGRKRQKSEDDDLLKYIDQEVQAREKFYPDWISRGLISNEEAYRKLQGMKAVFNYMLKVKGFKGVQAGLDLQVKEEPDDK